MRSELSRNHANELEGALPATGPALGIGPFGRFARATFEGAALLLALVAAEALFFGRGTYAELGLHPFWLPVLLVTLQHGIYAGSATALLASLLLDLPPQPPAADLARHQLEAAWLPFQWLLMATVIGIFRQRQVERERDAAEEIANLAAMNQAFAEEIRKLDDELWRFELAAATGERVAAPFAASARRTAGTTRPDVEVPPSTGARAEEGASA